jgi:hypothetical protein
MSEYDKTAFSTFYHSVEVERARSKYEEEDFNEILAHAKDGDIDAIIYLLAENIKQIVGVFKQKYNIAKKAFGIGYTDLSHDYFNGLLTHIVKMTKKGKGLFNAFKPEVFKEKDKDFLINKLGYYIYQYSKTYWGSKINKEIQTSTISMEDEKFNNPDGGTQKDNLQSHYGSFEQETQENREKEDFILFMNSLPGRRTPEDKKRMETLIRLKYDGVPREDILKTLQITPQRYYQLLGTLKEIYTQYVD